MKTKISLRLKFSAMLTGIIVLLGISIVWFIRTSVCNHLKAEIQRRAQFIAHDIAFESIDPILTMDVYALQTITFDHVGLHEDIFYIFITDFEGNILAHSFGARFPSDLMKPSIVANVGVGRTTRLETNKGEVFDVSSPVLGGRAGAVHVGILGEPIEKKVSAILWRIMWIIAGILALGCGLALYFVSFIVKPIRELTRAAEALGRGDLTQRAQVAAHDETGVLAEAFNEMAEDLMRTTTSITNLNAEIAARKQAEAALKESEARYRSLTDDVLDSSDLGLFILDADFKVVWINQAIERFFGMQRNQVIGKDKRELIHPQISSIFENPQEFIDKVISTYNNNTYLERFECHVLKDGIREERWLEHRSLPILSGLYAGGRMEHYIDITQRKRAEEALKLRFDLEELLTSISTEFISLEPDEIDDGIERALESIIDAVCVDRGYIFLYSPDGGTMDNTHERCRPGVPPHKDRPQDVPVEAFPWFDARMKRFETVAVESVASLTEEAEVEKKQWRHEDIQSLLSVPMVSRDRLMGFVGFDAVLYETQWREEIITFVTILGTVFANALDRKRSGQERQRLLKTLAAKNEELQSIVYVASHDLKSPLVNIQGFSGELSKACEQIDEVLHGEEVPADIQKQLAPLLDEDIPESIGFIRAGTAKMQALLNGLLEVCRVGSAVLQIQALDMNEIMKYIIASMQYQINDSGAELAVDDLPGCIGDTDHVNQVFSNLLTNAVKYLDPDRKGRIHISGRVEDGESIYCVRDNGLGIAPQHQQKVFEIFHRLEPDGDVKGEGLGLTIALRILERHEGRIWVESEPGKGSKFFVSLPTA